MIDRMLTIHQAAAAIGVSVKTLKRLEAAGTIPRASRAHNGYRVYSQDDVRRIRSIYFPESNAS